VVDDVGLKLDWLRAFRLGAEGAEREYPNQAPGQQGPIGASMGLARTVWERLGN
jgi:hypothetical protein